MTPGGTVEEVRVELSGPCDPRDHDTLPPNGCQGASRSEVASRRRSASAWPGEATSLVLPVASSGQLGRPKAAGNVVAAHG